MLVDNDGNNVSEGEALSSKTNAIILNKISSEESPALRNSSIV